MKSYKGVVQQGQKLGRTIGFPTINLPATLLPKDTPQGVYACFATIDNQTYKGALYFGPRLVLGETKVVLEIYILDFDQTIYGKSITFQLYNYIRPPKDFSSLEALQKELHHDVRKIRDILKNTI